ncbi:MAG: N-6 DNA methylase [Candidatus Sumerlaeota bacterium]|nr:N-6 DNA methylase [Candidatus Sumerlaeota bacterium]
MDYRNLGSEELGSVYESLLELHPEINTAAAAFDLKSAAGSERKTTGSYYTPSSLVNCLLDSALEPVMNGAAKASDPEMAILNLKVCDPACGSGHFLIAAAHRMAKRLATVRTRDEEPSPEAIQHALRDVISHCIYGVDINPMAIELCKVNLWMEALEPGKPLSFLDAHIQCGDSLVGVSPNLDISEIPDEAFNPAFGDDKATASALKKRNKRERTGQLGLRFEVTVLSNLEDLARYLANRSAQVDAMPEDDSAQVQAKSKAYDELHATREYLSNRLELDLWTAAFFWSIPKSDGESLLAPTQQELIQLRNGGELDSRIVEDVKKLAERLNFFHWELAFPKVFSGENPGFDCVLGNPPWEKNEVEERPFFASIRPDISSATNASKRKKMIQDLERTDCGLFMRWIDYKRDRDAIDKFFRFSNALPLTAAGKYNLYSLFAERTINLLSHEGRCGLIVQTGIATEDTTKQFFKSVSESGRLISLYDFENRLGLFAGIHRSIRFSLITLGGKRINIEKTNYAFLLLTPDDLSIHERRFFLTPTDYALINPNTRNCPIFRNIQEANLARRIYRFIPVLEIENVQNPWNLLIRRQFNIADDSELLRTYDDLVNDGYELIDTRFSKPETDSFVPFHEAKMMNIYDHRFGSFGGVSKEDIAKGNCRILTLEECANPVQVAVPRYWVPEDQWRKKIPFDYSWLIGFRWFTNTTNERTLVTSVVSKIACGDTLPCIYFQDSNRKFATLLVGNLSSFILDFFARQKLSGTHMNFFIIKQLPVLPPSAYTPNDIKYIAPRVLELVYTAYDLHSFAEDTGYHGEPFRWDNDRRFFLRCELDAAFFHLYLPADANGDWRPARRADGCPYDETPEQLAELKRHFPTPRDAVSYIMDTFPIVRRKDESAHGHYRTKDTILEIYDAMQHSIATDTPYQTRLTPSPADPRCCHPSRETKEGITSEFKEP